MENKLMKIMKLYNKADKKLEKNYEKFSKELEKSKNILLKTKINSRISEIELTHLIA